MASVESISAAIESVATKKENLRKAFEDLQSQPATLPSFAFCWKDLEEYFDSMEKSIHQSFEDLKLKEQRKQQRLQPTVESLPSHKEKSQEKDPANEPEKLEQDRLPELKSRCVEMDRKKFLSFFSKSNSDVVSIRDQILADLQSAPDPAELVLDVMEEFGMPETLNFFLHQLRLISPDIKAHVKEKALKVAVEVKGEVFKGGKRAKKTRTFLNLVSTYGLGSAFDADELLDFVVLVPEWVAQSVKICHDLGLSNKIPDLIQRLKSMGRLLVAVKYVCAFELADKFPPASLLKEFLQDAEKCAQEIREKGNNSIPAQNLATKKELDATKAVIKTIEELKLESEYPCEQLEKRIVELEKLMKAVPTRQQLAIEQEAPASSFSMMTRGNPPATQPAPLLIGGAQPYLGSAGTYGLVGPSNGPSILAASGQLGPPRPHLYPQQLMQSTLYPPATQPAPLLVGGAQPYPGSAGTYGLVGPSNGPSILAASGQLGPPRPHLYPQQLVQSSLYNKPTVHPSSDHLPPQPYHPSYYP